MRNKDDILLENLYHSIYIKEAVFQLTQSKMLEDVLKKTSSGNHAKLKYELTDDDGSRLLNKWLQSCTDEASQVAQQSTGAIILVKDLTSNGEQVNITQQVKAIASKPVDIHAADTRGKDQNIKYRATWVDKYKDFINKRTPYMLIFTAYATNRKALLQEFQWLEQMIEPFIKQLQAEGYDAHIDNDGVTISENNPEQHYLTDFYTACRFVDYVAYQIDGVTKKVTHPATIQQIPSATGGVKYTIEYKIKGAEIMIIARPDEEEDNGQLSKDDFELVNHEYSDEDDKAVMDEEYFHAIYVPAIEELVDQGIDFSSLDRDQAREIIRDHLMDLRREDPLSEDEIEEDMLERAVNYSRSMDTSSDDEDENAFEDDEDDDKD